MDNKELIGQRINTALAKRDMRQKQLAKAIRVTDNTISYFCSGKRTPNIQQLIAIAKELDVPTDYLLGRTNTMTVKEDIQVVCKTTGLSEGAVKTLHDLHNAPIEGYVVNRHESYEISYITLLSKLLEMDEDFRQIFQQLAYFMLYSEALPEQAYEDENIELSSDEHERFIRWVKSHKWEIVLNREASELHLQLAGEKFKAIYKQIFENETAKGDGRQWQALN